MKSFNPLKIITQQKEEHRFKSWLQKKYAYDAIAMFCLRIIKILFETRRRRALHRGIGPLRYIPDFFIDRHQQLSKIYNTFIKFIQSGRPKIFIQYI